ncbi:MAG: MMPL family transporter [Planctomycetaceae bacterium]|nr:MMPL family transporter [Planctomycetaceae bacterium]
MPSERMPQDSTSWMSRPLELLTRLVARFPLAILVLGCAAIGVSLWLTTTRLGFRTSRAELLSPKSDYNRRWLKYTEEFGAKEDVVVVVEGESREQIIPALDDVCRELALRRDMFGAVLHNPDAPKLRAKGLYFLKPEELAQIDAQLDQAGRILGGDWSALNLGSLAGWMNRAMTAGSEQDRQRLAATMQTELPRAMEGLRTALGQSGGYRSPWPEMPFGGAAAQAKKSQRMISDDGRMGFILLRLIEEDRQSFAQNDESIKVLRALAADVNGRHPGTKVGLTGLPIIEHDEMQSSEKSMSLATVVSFLGVLAVMIVAFGGFRHSTMAVLALVAAMIWTCGWVAAMIGHVNILSIAFGSVLLGLGIDYGIYFVARYLHLRSTTESTAEALAGTAASAGPGILTGALTSAIAFFAAGLTDFPGVAQLGVIAGGGVLLCWVAEATLLPAMIRVCDKDGPREDLPLPLNLRFWLRPLFAFPRFSLLVLMAATALCAIGLPYLHYDYNLLNLQPVGLQSVDLEHKLFNQANRSAWFAISVAATPAEAIARKEAFQRLPSVERVVDVASQLPTDTERKRPLIERIHQRLTSLPRQVPEIPVTPAAELERALDTAVAMLSRQPEMAHAVAGLAQLREALRQMGPAEYQRRIAAYQQSMAEDLHSRLQMLQGASSPEPPTKDDLPESVACRFIGKSGHFAMQVYSKANIWDVGPMGEFVADVRSVDPEATGNPLQVYEASRQMKRSFEQAAWYALLIIVPVVLMDFGRLNHTLLAALPMGIGLLQTLGLMGLLDIPLNQANMIMLPLTLGIGMESGINLLHELRCQRGTYRGAGNAVLVAVAVNSLTTMVGFGALMIANHRGLQSLGRALTLSMGCCLLCSLFLPNLLVLGRFGGNDEDSAAEYDELGDEACMDDPPPRRPASRIGSACEPAS